MSWAELEVACADIYERLGDELDGTLFLAVDSRHVQYYQTFETGWETVFANFPSSIPDIEEASKCFALNRYTACVFHLMRVAEAGLAATAKRIGLTNPRPGWEEAISYIEGQLNKKHPEMDAMFKGDVNFLREIAAHMRDVNIAWRRCVAHIESKYTEEEAERILTATKGLMEHMASKLSEVDG